MTPTTKKEIREEFFKKFGYHVKSSKAMTTGESNAIADFFLEKLDHLLEAKIKVIKIKRIEHLEDCGGEVDKMGYCGYCDINPKFFNQALDLAISILKN